MFARSSLSALPPPRPPPLLLSPLPPHLLLPSSSSSFCSSSSFSSSACSRSSSFSELRTSCSVVGKPLRTSPPLRPGQRPWHAAGVSMALEIGDPAARWPVAYHLVSAPGRRGFWERSSGQRGAGAGRGARQWPPPRPEMCVRPLRVGPHGPRSTEGPGGWVASVPFWLCFLEIPLSLLFCTLDSDETLPSAGLCSPGKSWWANLNFAASGS